MRQRMPGGASALSKVPKLHDVARASAGGPGKKISQATAVAAYEKEVRETTKVFHSEVPHDRGNLGGARQVHDLNIEVG